MAIFGELIFEGEVVYTVPVSRQSDAATFRLEVLTITASTTVRVQPQHRNINEETWIDVGTNQTRATAGFITDIDVADVRELVRLKVDFSTTGDTTRRARVRIPAPIWR